MNEKIMFIYFLIQNHLTPYMTCTVPEIMDCKFWWISYWNALIMIVALAHTIMGPYCVSFGENSDFEENMCKFLYCFNIPVAILYIMDVFIEIIAGVPVYGTYD